MNSQQFRNTLSRFASGVTVMTARHNDQLVGVTISAFTSLSLDPPLVLFCLDKKAATLPVFTPGTAFAAHILHGKQKKIAEHFGRKEPRNWNNIPHHFNEFGVPVLDEHMAVLYCNVAERLAGGDHLIITARVHDAFINDKRPRPLIHTQRAYYYLGRKKK